jgi:hypothetical protein
MLNVVCFCVGKTTLLNLIAGRIPPTCLHPPAVSLSATRGASSSDSPVPGASSKSDRSVHNQLGANTEANASNNSLPRPGSNGHPSAAEPASRRLFAAQQYEGRGEILFNNSIPNGAKRRDLIGYGANCISTVPLPVYILQWISPSNVAIAYYIYA